MATGRFVFLRACALMPPSAERLPVGERAADDLAGDGGDHGTSRSSAGDNGGRIDGSRAASIDLPAPGGADHEHVIASSGKTAPASAMAGPLIPNCGHARHRLTLASSAPRRGFLNAD